MKIADLPFVERPILELLDFSDDRTTVDRDYAGYGWARTERIWLCDGESREVAVDDALIVAIHAADEGEPLPDDVELVFELPGGAPPAIVLASTFLATWLPMLPQPSAIVLAMCNWFGAQLPYPEGARVPVYLANGDVEAWLDEHKGGRIELCTDGTWARLTA